VCKFLGPAVIQKFTTSLTCFEAVRGPDALSVYLQKVCSNYRVNSSLSTHLISVSKLPRYFCSMSSKVLVALVSVVLGIYPLSPAQAIENGIDATGNSHVVKIVSKYNTSKVKMCSGGVLSEYIVVTAAHCLDDESGLLSKEIWVLPPGSVSNRDSSGAYLRDSTWISVDGTQITLTYQNSSQKVEDDDLAFLVLSKPVELKISTSIPSEDETLRLKSSNAPLRLYGYGYISDSGNSSDAPRYYIARFDSQTPTSVKNSGYASSSESTSCQGDSGGPVLSITPTNVTVVGVITGGATSVRCGKKQNDGKYYTLFTYLSRYANLAFAAASSANKKVAESSNQLKLSAEEAKTKAESDLATTRQESSNLQSELKSTQDELSDALFQIEELERVIQNLQNEIKLLTSKLTVTINCVKGSRTKKVTGIDPKCPTGYKKK